MEAMVENKTISLYRYKCGACKSKSFMHDFMYESKLCCPVCGERELIYDQPVVLLLEKGKTSRKVRYLVCFEDAENNKFYVETTEPREMRRVAAHMMDLNGLPRRVKAIQHFGTSR